MSSPSGGCEVKARKSERREVGKKWKMKQGEAGRFGTPIFVSPWDTRLCGETFPFLTIL